MYRAVFRTIVLLALSCGLASAAQRPGGFRVIGPGGGGAMFHPTISPHDANTVLISCDMTGSYITHDGGHSWRMFNLRGVTRFFVFDPLAPHTIYAEGIGLWRSTDDGETWKLLDPKPSAVRGIEMSSDHAEEKILAQTQSARHDCCIGDRPGGFADSVRRSGGERCTSSFRLP